MAIVRDTLDVEQTSVGLKADGAQFRQVFDAPADAKIPIAHHRARCLQCRHVDIEVHPVDPLDLEVT